MRVDRLLSFVVIQLIEGYRRLISPLLPPACRFSPTCSAYAIQAIRRYGVFDGMGLAVGRLLRCNPSTPGGYDPVPSGEARRGRSGVG